jgi:hypothetical protein
LWTTSKKRFSKLAFSAVEEVQYKQMVCPEKTDSGDSAGFKALHKLGLAVVSSLLEERIIYVLMRVW